MRVSLYGEELAALGGPLEGGRGAQDQGPTLMALSRATPTYTALGVVGSSMLSWEDTHPDQPWQHPREDTTLRAFPEFQKPRMCQVRGPSPGAWEPEPVVGAALLVQCIVTAPSQGRSCHVSSLCR